MPKKGWVSNFLNRLIDTQSSVLQDIPEEKRRQGYGRAAKMIIDGPEGGVFNLWLSENGIQEKPADVPIKNTIYMSEDVLLNLITPDINDLDTLVALVEKVGVGGAVPQLSARLPFRVAIANRLITISGEKSDVDSEEWAQIFDKILLKIALPLVVRAMITKAKKKEGGSI